jgi:hypothetical protein
MAQEAIEKKGHNEIEVSHIPNVAVAPLDIQVGFFNCFSLYP